MQRIGLMILSMLLWLCLTWRFSPQDLIVGGSVSVFAGLIFGDYFFKKQSLKIFNPVRWFFFILYIPYFLWYMLEANLRVMYLVLHPKMPIKPGIVKVKTEMRSKAARVFLANSITLTPGTLTVDIIDDEGWLYIHWISVESKEIEKDTELIVRKFERIIRRIFE